MGIANERLEFSCSGCGLKLSVAAAQAGISGPCPSCGTVVQAPFAQDASSAPGIPAAGQARKHRTRVHSGRISGDSTLDHKYQETRETTKSLLIILGFILAMAACLTVTWFMSDLMRK